ELWRVHPQYLAEAQADATRLAIADQVEAGLDILTDGEIGRESYSNAFATALDGVDIDNPGMALDRSGHPNPVPRIVGPISRRHAVNVEALRFLRARAGEGAAGEGAAGEGAAGEGAAGAGAAGAGKIIKVTVPGPFTMAQQAQNDFYPTLEE